MLVAEWCLITVVLKAVNAFVPKNFVQVNITSLQQESDFSRLKQSRNKYIAKSAIIVFDQTPISANTPSEIRAGFIVTKKTGIAVKRNRIRRRLRAALRAASKICPVSGYDIIFIAKRQALSIIFADMVAELVQALEKMRNYSGSER